MLLAYRPRGHLRSIKNSVGSFISSDGLLAQKQHASRDSRYFSYLVRVRTGELRGAGTKANVAVVLSGRHGVSDKLHIEGGEHSPFRHSGVAEFTIEGDVGTPTEVLIGHDETDLGSGWYVDQVEVLKGENVWTFPCFHWLGISDNGGQHGPAHVRLVPQPVESIVGLSDEGGCGPVDVIASSMCVPRRSQVEVGNKGVVGKFFGHGGEDAYMIWHGDSLSVLAVADGVHEWRKSNIDSGEWSRSLLKAVKVEAEQGQSHPLEIMKGAFSSVLTAGVQGSSTVCTLVIDTVKGVLSSANIGDSGFRVLRDNRVVLSSPQQEHFFGCPYQLGHHETSDSPEHAQIVTTALQPGDVLVAGSDGLFDNVDNRAIEEQVSNATSILQLAGGSRAGASRAASVIAHGLITCAFANSVNKSAMTPYSLAATEEFNMIYSGGKPDDITVVVAAIVGPQQLLLHD